MHIINQNEKNSQIEKYRKAMIRELLEILDLFQ